MVHKATPQAHKPTIKDWKVAKRIVCYLKGSKVLKFYLSINGPTTDDIKIDCWSDADFAADKVDRKSVSGCGLPDSREMTRLIQGTTFCFSY